MSGKKLNPIEIANDDDRREKAYEDYLFNKRHGNNRDGSYDTSQDHADWTHSPKRASQGSNGSYGYEGTPSTWANPEQWDDESDHIGKGRGVVHLDGKHFPDDPR